MKSFYLERRGGDKDLTFFVNYEVSCEIIQYTTMQSTHNEN